MNAARLVKGTVPPLIRDALVAYRNRRQWKSYPDFESAMRDCPGGAYQDEELVRTVIAKEQAFNERMKSDPVLDLGAARTLVGVSFAACGDSLNVLDFGGAGGHHYTMARTAFPRIRTWRWNVVETPAMVLAARRFENGELRFFDSIEAAAGDLGRIDLVFASGVLQYCQSPLEVLRSLLGLGARTVFVTRTGLHAGEGRLITVQRSDLRSNGIGPLPPGFRNRPVFYPAVFESKAEFEGVLREHYDIRLSLREDMRAYFVRGVPIDMFGYLCTLKGHMG